MFLIGMCSTMAPVVAATNDGINKGELIGLFILSALFLISFIITMTLIGISGRKERFAMGSPEYNKYDNMFNIGIYLMITVSAIGILIVISSIAWAYITRRY